MSSTNAMVNKQKKIIDYDKRRNEPEPESVTKSLIGKSKMGQFQEKTTPTSTKLNSKHERQLSSKQKEHFERNSATLEEIKKLAS